MLLGTALAALLAAGVLLPQPVGAQTIIDNQTNTGGDSEHKSYSGKRTSTILTIIANPIFSFANNKAAIANSTDPNQLIDFTQANDIESDIVIVNTGFIDPVVGIDSQIDNAIGSLANNIAGAVNDYGATASVAVVQRLKADQSNIVANEITKNNSGNIVADLEAIFAAINNIPIGSLANNVAGVANTNGAAATINLGDVTQSMNFIQTNTIGSDITIVNRGNLNADIGVFAVINTDFTGSLANNAAGVANANGDAVAFTVTDLAQSIDLAQANAIGSSIEIHNYGGATGDDTGLVAEINNLTIGSLANNVAGLANVNGGAEAVGLTDLAQVIELNQSNEISGDLSIYNYGGVTTNCCGIDALIRTQTVGSLANNATGLANANGSAGALILADIAQSIELTQGNTIDNAIGIYNSAAIGSGLGITAWIDTQDIGGLSNIIENAENANGSAALVTADDVTQSFDLLQNNVVESQIVISNSNGVTADGGFGVWATIDTVDLDDSLLNSIDVGNANGDAALVTIGSLDESADFTQYNTVFSQIVVNDTGATNAETGILAEIRTIGLGASNIVTIANENGTATLINDDDLTQSADIVQKNQVINEIAIQNGSALAASETGIRASIEAEDLSLANDATFSFSDDASEIADDLSQTAQIEQTNSVSNRIAITNAGGINAGDIGVSAEIVSGMFSLSNTVSGAFAAGANVAGDLTQTANVTQTNRVDSTIAINNSGSIRGANRGIVATIGAATVTSTNSLSISGGQTELTRRTTVTSAINIDNSGSITAGNLFAIETAGASTTVINRAAGVITGFISLSDEGNLFDNRAGGIFEARLASDFGADEDLFDNEGVVHAVASGGTQPSFTNLERFENSGAISTVNGTVGDVFTMSGPNFQFVADEGSALAVDAFLGKPGSKADNLVIDGDVSGQTELIVNNTNPRGGAYNKQGIPVVFVNGNVERDAFFLPKPIDAGFVDYDLFFVPTGSGYFELRSLPGGGAHHLPHIVTAVQDVFHSGTETWFDRTADLRVLLNGGVPVGGSSGGKLADGAPQVSTSLTPATWIKGSGTWLEQDDKASTRAYGRTYRYDLSRDLDVWNLQGGIDFGKKGVLAEGDALVFGALGGWIHGDLDYDHLVRQFDMEGGEAGAYATYLNGGLFVDTLFKATFLEVDPNNSPGFSGTFDATAWGVRTDTGYRFGGFRGGPVHRAARHARGGVERARQFEDRRQQDLVRRGDQCQGPARLARRPELRRLVRHQDGAVRDRQPLEQSRG